MAGLFGFLDFTKEGPGIRKDAPKKKSFFVFFETFFRNFWRFITINVVYTLVSLPIITGGMASAGLTNITRNIARDKHSFGLSDFFDTIRKNWKQSLAVGFINTVINALLLFGIWFYNASYLETEQNLSLAGLLMCILLLALFAMMKFYIFTLMITFNFKIKALYVNSFKFVLLNFWRSILCGIAIIAVYALYAVIFLMFPYWPVLITELFMILLTVPAFKYLMIQYFTFGSIKKYIIDPYYKEHPDADIEKRRDLGLDVPNDNEYDDMCWE